MDFKININGVLYLKRKGRWVSAECRFGGGDPMTWDFAPCDHCCPHFHEPIPMRETTFPGPGAPTGKYQLHLCRGTFIQGEFTDERKETSNG